MLNWFIDKNKNKLIRLTMQLISIPTNNPPGENYDKIADFIEKYCKRLALDTKRIITPKSELKKYKISAGSERINLIAKWDVGAQRTLHINSHYDVVPATSSWKTQPFKPVLKQGKLYGRGAEDMKANIAAVLIAIEALGACGIKPGCNIELSFTPDEEIGGRTGFGYLVRKNIIKPDYAISEGYCNDYISCGNKGVAWFNIEIKGRSCHGSEPHKGINAFEKMIFAANEFLLLKKSIEKRKTLFPAKSQKNRFSTMMMGGEVCGGQKINIVPDRICFTIDRRFLPEENIEDVKKEISNLIRKLKKKDKHLDIEAHLMSEEDSVVSDEKSILFKEFKKSVRNILKKKPKCALLSGATDIRFLIRKGIPCLGYSADGAGSGHSDNEFVYIKSLINTTKIFADVISNLK
jgi:succinyl-diaminopimelate desuccinylase